MTRATVTLMQTICRHLVGIVKAFEDWIKSLVIKD